MATAFRVGASSNWDGTTTHWANVSGGTGGTGVSPGNTDVARFDANSGAVTVTVAVGRNPLDIDCTGWPGTLAGSQAMTVSGLFKLDATMAGFTYSGALTYNSTTGVTQDVTSAGFTWAGTSTFNGVGGKWRFADAFTSSTTIGLTNGDLDFNSVTIRCSAFGSNNSNTRTIRLGNSLINPTGTGNVWNLGTITGLTMTAGGASKILIDNGSATAKSAQFATLTYDDVEFGGSGSGAFSFSTGAPSFRDFLVSNTGGGGFSTTAAPVVRRNLDFTGYTGTWSGTAGWSVAGNITLGAGMTVTSTGTMTCNGTGTQSITSNGKAFAGNFTLSHTGTVQLADAMQCATLNHQTGTLDTNNKDLTCTGQFLSASGLTRTVNLGTSKITCTNTGTCFQMTGAGLTANMTACTILLNNATASSKTFSGGGLSYGTLQCGGAGSGVFIIAASNTFAALQILNGPHTVDLTAGTGQIVGDVSGLSGTAGNLNTLQSHTAGTPANIQGVNAPLELDYCNLKDVKAVQDVFCWAGLHSVDQGGNNGWRFRTRSRGGGF